RSLSTIRASSPPARSGVVVLCPKRLSSHPSPPSQRYRGTPPNPPTGPSGPPSLRLAQVGGSGLCPTASRAGDGEREAAEAARLPVTANSSRRYTERRHGLRNAEG